MRAPFVAGTFLLAGLAALAVGAGAREEGAPPALQAEDRGVHLDLKVEAVDGKGIREGADVAVRFRISDEATGTPLPGLYPAAWMDPVGAGEVANTGDCTRKVEAFLGGSLFSRPAVDLNAYYVLALNADSTITVVDPLFGFGGTKLLAMVDLRSPGQDWVLTRDATHLLVSLPDSDRLAVVEAAAWKVTKELEAGPRPGRLALQPDGAYLWVALDGPGGGSGVAAVDLQTLRVAARIATGAGPHDLVVSDDSRFVFVTNRGAGTASVIDVARLARLHDVPVGPAPVSIAYSPLAKAAYVADEKTGRITAVSPSRREPAAVLQARPGLGQLRFAPGGRLGFVVDPGHDLIHIFDAASNRVVQTGEMQDGPDQVTFSGDLAYVRHRGSEIVLMIPLSQVGQEGKPIPVVDFPAGQNPAGRMSRPSPADSIVRAPGATAVLVANPADKAIYYYKEGTAAPMGSFVNYGREPRAVLVVDRSLKERSPGSYETVARLGQPGRYQAALFLDSPRTVRCFDFEVAADPEAAERRRQELPLVVEPKLERTTLRMGETLPLRYRLLDPRTLQPKEDLQDVGVLVVLGSGTWHRRLGARALGGGLYEADLTPPAAGSYTVSVECPSQKLPYHLAPQVVLRVTEEPPKPSP